MTHPLRARILALGALSAAGLLAAAPSGADSYTNVLAKCMVRSSTPADRAEFVKFLFSSIAQHPDVASMASITPQQLEATVKDAAALVQRLLLQACRVQAQQAIHFEGTQSIYLGFQLYGQAMAAELLGNPVVASKMQDLNKYLDEDKFMAFMTEAAVGGATAPAPSKAAPPAPPAVPKGP